MSDTDNVIVERQLHPYLFYDADTNKIYDIHIEDMFDTLFKGEEIDDDFKKSFNMYINIIANGKADSDAKVPDEVFTDTLIAKSVASLFGIMLVRRTTQQERHDDEDLADKYFCATLRSTLTPGMEAPCHGCTELYAVLLAIVHAIRCYAEKLRETDEKLIYLT